ncbi:hypothetical protein MAR_001743 [Mya arenaria]|uniref:Uncharacterized protein n=1 Tax=Mya arenaria TaxID=6604 RepID=A0ABY7FCT0_MYAAR|nr:hypothetical protein MAR_001743 [Mya arenaria]
MEQQPSTSDTYRTEVQGTDRVQEGLKRKNQQLRQKVCRLKLRTTPNAQQKSPKTPKWKSDSEMLMAGIQPQNHPNIRKKLMFANCLVREIRDQVITNDRKGQKIIKKIVAGKILRKYKMTQYTANLVGVRIRYKAPTRDGPHKSKEFLEREDNSRQLPGKADTVKNERKERVQKFVLNDYLRNIFLKFKAEHPEEKVSFATFCRARPKHITLVNYAARVTCLCTKHQNFALKLQCLKIYGVTTNTSPDSFSENLKSIVSEDNVHFKEWKRVKCEDGKQRTNCGWQKYCLNKVCPGGRKARREKTDERAENTDNTVSKTKTASDGGNQQDGEPDKATITSENTEIGINVDGIRTGEFIAAMYDNEAYVGKVTDIDEGLFEVSYLEKGSKVKDCLKWPKRHDEIWVEPSDILCRVEEPTSTGRGNRFFKLSSNDVARVDDALKNKHLSFT